MRNALSIDVEDYFQVSAFAGHIDRADWDRLPGAAIIRGAGGVSVVVPAAGVDWTVSGAPAAVADVRSALLDR